MANVYQRRRRKTPKAFPVSVPAPVTGWNTRDALDAMAPTDAVYLDNWFPTTGKVSVRKGYESFATGMGTNVDTLAEYHAGATRKFIAAGNSNLYEISSGTPSSLGSGYTSNQWQWVNFSGRMFLVNGEDDPLDYDGSSLSTTSWSGSGLTNSDLIGVNVFKNRLYFWEKDSQDFWYAAAAGVTGTLTKFPLSRVGQFGGNLVAMGTWTHDGGDGADDYAVFIMSSGEVIVYSGSDPGSASAWALVGVYRIGVPLGIRGVVKLGGDLMVMTRDDYVSLSAVLQSGQIGNPSKLSGAVRAAAEDYAANFGWQAILYKQGEMMIFNVPASDTVQHVVNTTTGAACRFTGIEARCFGVYNGDLYYGSTDGTVYKANTGDTDAGAAIPADGRTAWASFGQPIRSRVTAVRPVIESEGSVNYELGVGFDFSDALTPTPSSTAATGSLWDTAMWDVSPWSSELQTSVTWKASRGTGQSVSSRLRVNGKQKISWIRTDYRVEQGTAL